MLPNSTKSIPFYADSSCQDDPQTLAAVFHSNESRLQRVLASTASAYATLYWRLTIQIVPFLLMFKIYRLPLTSLPTSPYHGSQRHLLLQSL